MNSSPTASRPVEFYFSYAHNDELLRDQLVTHLSFLRRQGIVEAWHERAITPQEMWRDQIDEHLESATLILLLISPDFLASDYCAGVEVARAMEKHESGESLVIPIILRPCDWREAPFGKLQVLPKNARPVTSWKNRDEAFLNISQGINQAIKGFLAARSHANSPTQMRDVRRDKPYGVPAIWNVPFKRNADFTGREAIIAKLNETLLSGQRAVFTQAIYGPAGVGKTRVAVEYAYRYAARYNLVWWVRAEEPLILAADYARLAAQLDLPEKGFADQQVIISAVRRWLGRNDGWLLIFDDARERSDLEAYLPTTGTGHVLITSRNSNWRSSFASLPLNTLTREESVHLLLRRSEKHKGIPSYGRGYPPESPFELASAIAEELGDLPIALEQAGAYINETDCSFSEYLTLIRQQRNELLAHSLPLAEYSSAVAVTCALSLQQVKRLPAAIWVIRGISFLAPGSIPLSILRYLSSNLPRLGHGDVYTPDSIEEATAVLGSYSLLEFNNPSYISVHPLTQAAVRNELSQSERGAWLLGVLPLIAETIEEREGSERRVRLDLLPHVLAVINHSRDAQVEDISTAWLLHRIGLYLADRRDYLDAQVALEQALSIIENIYPEGHTAFLYVAVNLAEVLRNQGDLKRARKYYENALARAEKVPDTKHSILSIIFNGLGVVLQEQGDLATAKNYQERGFDIARQLGDEFQLARHAANLGHINQGLGYLEEARSYFDEALRLDRHTLGQAHPLVAQDLRNLADLSKTQRDFADARSLYEQALAIDQSIYGPYHPEVALNLKNLGQILLESNDLDAAHGYFEQALNIDRQTLGNEHPIVAMDLKQLGDLFKLQGDLLAARQNYERALEIAGSIYSSDHPTIGLIVNNLSSVLQEFNNLAPPQGEQESALVQSFLSAAGFQVRPLATPSCFTASPSTPLWQKKLKSPVYVELLTGRRLDMKEVLRISEVARNLSGGILYAFVVVNRLIEDSAWLQIATLRANKFNVIPIPLTILLDNRSKDKPLPEGIILSNYLERFIGQGVDPYDVRHPVSDVINFFGRESLSQTLTDRLAQGQPIGLFGLRKMGKSSLMHYMQQLMPFPTARLDLQAGVAPQSVYERMLRLWNSDAQVRFNIDIGFDQVQLDAHDPTTGFVKYTQQILDKLSSQSAEPRLVIFLDEIELIAPPVGASDSELKDYLSLMRTLRGMVQEQRQISLMVAGVDPSINRVSRWGKQQNPLFQLMQEVYLPPLLKSDCVQMIRNIGLQVELTYSDDAAEFVSQASGGHPSLARQLCSLAYKERGYRPGEVSLPSLRAAAQRFLDDPQYAVFLDNKGLWNEVASSALWGDAFSDANEQILIELAKSDGPLRESTLTAGRNAAARRSSLFALSQLSVIRQGDGSDEEGDPKYSISFGLFRSWIRRIKLGFGGYA
jgi:tetratricopeptide (TPR) repeat protein